MEIKELLSAGQLQESVAAATQKVRENPFDVDARSLLVECLILADEFDRADKQLDTIAYQHPEMVTGVSLLRQLIRGEMARQEFFLQGRVPEFVDLPDESIQEMIRASIFLRSGEMASAFEVYEKVEEGRAPTKGSCNGESFDDFRDLDDQLGQIIEVLTSTGKYFWIPVSMIKKIEFRPIERPIDMKWRRAYVETTKENLDGEVYIPGIYVAAENKEDDVKLGRTTDWLGSETEPFRGVGQKMFLVGEDSINLMDVQEIEFEH